MCTNALRLIHFNTIFDILATLSYFSPFTVQGVDLEVKAWKGLGYFAIMNSGSQRMVLFGKQIWMAGKCDERQQIPNALTCPSTAFG